MPGAGATVAGFEANKPVAPKVTISTCSSSQQLLSSSFGRRLVVGENPFYGQLARVADQAGFSWRRECCYYYLAITHGSLLERWSLVS